MTVLIATGAFWLSFTALRSLTITAGVPQGEAWLWPLIIEGSMAHSTVALLALAHFPSDERAHAIDLRNYDSTWRAEVPFSDEQPVHPTRNGVLPPNYRSGHPQGRECAPPGRPAAHRLRSRPPVRDSSHLPKGVLLWSMMRRDYFLCQTPFRRRGDADLLVVRARCRQRPAGRPQSPDEPDATTVASPPRIVAKANPMPIPPLSQRRAGHAVSDTIGPISAAGNERTGRDQRAGTAREPWEPGDQGAQLPQKIWQSRDSRQRWQRRPHCAAR